MDKEDYNKKIEDLFENIGCDLEDLMHGAVQIMRSLDKIKRLVCLRDKLE